MTDCPFCDLDSEKTRTIRKGKLTTVILSNPRLMPGHTLVIPNRHIEEPWQLTDEEILEIFNDIKFVQAKLLSDFATGCDVRQNYRPFIPQGRVKIDHVHFHVLPRTSEDELFQKSMRFERELFLDLPEDERGRMVSLFEA
jgi:diadenosine tetraphosphate (Ap4A) HIT family hydrolase